ncbi:putative mandelate racemase [Cucurbitaria berberidis CBS 394.84]|uniref:Mandelate racemase n=1 Tax=Cucurbitaria berberidis CBS 394.84 TaxID=1168544 RepID=A0A9P4LB66_9PLEO|nr:putative mandelate racemase [Cucurbitaria berberidis CBS 394.84]KAF1848062.1 putative mandelate racemase [Cucurbitaria berberidis CBS 394.84]
MVDLAITRIDVFQVDLPYSHGVYVLSAGREYRSFDSTIVRITTNTGIEGWGESCPFGSTYVASHALGVRAGLAQIAPSIIGLDPRRVDRINDAMDAALLGHEAAKAAIDIACWDAFGKSVGLSVCELLGGRTNVKLPTISSIGVMSPEDVRKQVAKDRANGYRGYSIKIGQEPAADAALIVAAMADKQPGEFFLVDANCGLTVETALRTLKLLPEGLDFVHPMIFDELATNEASIVQAIADDAAEGIGFKISKAGGLTRGRRQRDICIAAGYTISVQDTVGSDISFATIVHLAQTIPERNLRCILDTRDMVTVKTADCDYPVHDGLVTAPSAPGLGMKPRLDVLGEPVASYY